MTNVQTMRMGFLDVDDRLLLDFVFADRVETLLITRRITRRLILGAAQVLAQSNPLLSRVPTGHKTDMLVWEHLSALRIEDDGNAANNKDATQPARRPQSEWQLLQKLDIDTQTTAFHLRFEGHAGATVAVSMNRNELHRLLASLRQLARRAEWDLDAEVGWLVEADAPLQRPGSLAS